MKRLSNRPMRHRAASEAPFTLSEVLEEEFRVVHDCRGRFFEFHWNNPAHIAERLKILSAGQANTKQEETVDLEMLRKFSDFATLGKDQRKQVEAALTRFTTRLNELARDPNLTARLLPNNPGQDTEEIRSFQKSQCDANARLLQCLMGEWIHPRSEPATRTAYFTASDLENATELARELDRRFSIVNPFLSPGTASKERRERAVLDALNRLVTKQNMYVTALATANHRRFRRPTASFLKPVMGNISINRCRLRDVKMTHWKKPVWR